jgi:hypothetical protein
MLMLLICAVSAVTEVELTRQLIDLYTQKAALVEDSSLTEQQLDFYLSEPPTAEVEPWHFKNTL